MKAIQCVKVAVCALFVAGALTAMAQGGGGGRQGGGFGQGRMGGGNSAMQLLGRNDVQKDLAITADQKTKIDAFRQKQQEEQRARFEEMRNSGGGGGFDQEAMRKMMEENQKKEAAEVAKILTKEQVDRLLQIRIQLAKGGAVLIPEVQKALGLTTEQLDKIKALQAKQQEANQSLMEKMRNQELSREEFTAARTKNEDALNSEIAKVLTDDQKSKLKDMAGKEFKAEPQPGRGGGGGGF